MIGATTSGRISAEEDTGEVFPPKKAPT